MPLYGRYGLCLRAPPPRKFLKDPQKRKRRIGLTLAVKHGSKNVGGNALLDDHRRTHEHDATVSVVQETAASGALVSTNSRCR